MTPKEVRKVWANDLRANVSLQGHGALRVLDEDMVRFCCLGRLCELAKEAGITESPKSGFEDDYYGPVPSDSLMPKAVYEWAGITVQQGDDLAGKNDSRSWDFNKIADLVEAL